MAFYVYILKCADGTYYTGHTDNLDARMAQHGDGEGCAYTAKRRPSDLLWTTDCQTRTEAFDLEKRIQGWSRVRKEALMRGDFEALPGLSRSRPGSPFDKLRVSALGGATIYRITCPPPLTLSLSKGPARKGEPL